MTASWHKIFSSDPTIGYWAQHRRFRDALDQGLNSFGSATSREAMEAVVRNTAVQGVLSIVFAVLVIVVVAAALVACLRAIRVRAAGGEPQSSEEPFAPSQLFAPAGLVATAAEKEIEKEVLRS
ncbi:hypothetical protein Cocul_00989 [Corynebacterium oculi]|uniref:Uncharacterized protein n=1 Tax=Corynebacterium oculi TaxID=1544416 RepID=A0A0Q0Z456_9CORY|nr:hypothetical protein Cocul_00989 [Corynebacterium oculi]